MPFRTGSVDTICAIHLLEHLHEWDAKKALREWLRILKPGGKLILELPCMDKILMYIARTVENNESVVEQMVWWSFWGNPRGGMKMHHNYGYTISMLKKYVLRAGFATVKFMEPRYHVKKRDMRLEALKGAL